MSKMYEFSLMLAFLGGFFSCAVIAAVSIIYTPEYFSIATSNLAKMEAMCASVGSTPSYFNRGGVLMCDNGSKFEIALGE